MKFLTKLLSVHMREEMDTRPFCQSNYSLVTSFFFLHILICIFSYIPMFLLETLKNNFILDKLGDFVAFA